MMWMIASVPFWLIGAVLWVIAVVGAFHCLKSDRTSKDLMETLCGFIVFATGASLFFAIAAKVAS